MIKNMVCPRCIESVQSVFEELNLAVTTIELGKVTLKETINSNQKQELKTRLKAKGFELLADKQTQIINEGRISKCRIIKSINYYAAFFCALLIKLMTLSHWLLR